MENNDLLKDTGVIFVLFVAAFFIVLLLGQRFLLLLKRFNVSQQIREAAVDGKSAPLFRSLHLKKSGTPTMGGILIWGVIVLIVFASMLFQYFEITKFSLWNRRETYLPVFTLVTVALLGAVDDFFNIRNVGAVKGLRVKPKMFWLTLFAVLGAWWFYFKLGWWERPIWLPGLGDYHIGLWVVPLFILVIISAANAVNFTDGLDGLAGGLLAIAFGAFGIIAFAQGLNILAAFCAVVAGATLGFLWFNVPPASFYMGDTGSFSLGATLGVISMLTNSVFLLPIVGFVFVVEGMSSLLQILSKRFRGRKIFHIAPFHHHLEYLGWPETKITLRLWIVGGITAIAGILWRLV